MEEVGGRFTKSVLRSSEEIHDFNCSPCLDEHKYNKAIKYCVTCKRYYCMKCLGEHNKFPSLQGHRMKDATSLSKSTAPRVDTDADAASLLDPCELHPNETIKMFCGEHDTVCCTVCIALDHRNCEGVNYIPKVAKGIRTSPMYAEFLKDTETMKEELHRMKEDIKEELQKLSEIREGIIEDLKQYKNELIEQLDQLEAKSIDMVNETYERVTKKMKETALRVNKCLSEVQDCSRESNNEKEASLFIRVKSLRRENFQKVETLTDAFEGLSFSLNKHVQSTLDGTDGLVEQHFPSKAANIKSVDISFKDDESVCAITDICPLDDGTLILSDMCNQSLKRLNKSFRKLEKLDMCGEPFGICKTHLNDELAVTLRVAQQVRFVSYSKKLMQKTAFDVGAPCKCIGLVGRVFFITCGGGDTDSVLGQIRRFDIAGTLLDIIEYDDRGNRLFTSPRHLTLSVDKTKLLVVDRHYGVIVLDMTGRKQEKQDQYKHVSLKGAFAVTSSGYGYFVTGSYSDNIHQFDDKYRYIGTVLDKTDGVSLPMALTPWLAEFGGHLLSMDQNNNLYLVQM